MLPLSTSATRSFPYSVFNVLHRRRIFFLAELQNRDGQVQTRNQGKRLQSLYLLDYG